MARITQHVKSARGKDIKCSKCGKPIEVGMSYLKATPYKRPPIIRCTNCGLKSYETSGSSYVQSVGEIVECWQTTYGTSEGTAEEIVDELTTIKEECEDNLENIPEQLKDAEAGSLLQERIEELEDCINELENIDYDSLKDECREEAECDAGDEPEDENSEEHQAWEEAVAEELDNLVEQEYIEAIDEALSILTY